MLSSLKLSIQRFLAEEDGPTAVEYAIMVALIAGICVASVNFMAAETTQSFDDSRLAIEAAN